MANDHREGGEARVDECDAHTVRFTLLASGMRLSEPIGHVTIGYDEEKHRRRIVVTGY